MYNETYDEYIRSILGYPATNSYNNYQRYNNQNSSYQNQFNFELEDCYPEIYKIVYPMVKTKCSTLRKNVTNEELENMVDEIYNALDINEVRSSTSNVRQETERKTEVRASEKLNEKRETRQVNRGLRDLIKILLIRELLNRHGRPPLGPRPHYDIFEY